METDFTPYFSIIGGALIAFSVLMMLAFNGRVTGISGFIHSLARGKKSVDNGLFIAGIILGAFLYMLFNSGSVVVREDYSILLLILSGLFVGIGTRLGSGCTSGHGICGISRFSLRSIIATMTFMLFGGISTYLIRHIF